MTNNKGVNQSLMLSDDIKTDYSLSVLTLKFLLVIINS